LTVRRIYSRVPPEPPTRRRTMPERLVRFGAGQAAFWACLSLARLGGVPGTGLQLRLAALALAAARRDIDVGYAILRSGLDAVRYFEFDFAWRSSFLPEGGRYLDVSSPRLLPLLLARRAAGASVDLVNPAEGDLAETRRFVVALGLGNCQLHRAKVAELDLRPASYDLVTSISVIEHIASPGDAEAVRAMWRLVKPGGRLVVTVPVAREAVEEHIDRDPYGLGQSGTDGFFFFQRFYDEAALGEIFFRETGAPAHRAVFGERLSGVMVQEAERRRAGLSHWWNEPWRAARRYRRYGSIAELPGLGVVGLEFRKQ
jgi:SAM-dependent methyltransferase